MDIKVNPSGIDEFRQAVEQADRKFCELRTIIDGAHIALGNICLELEHHEESKFSMCSCGKAWHYEDAVFCSACGRKLRETPREGPP